MPGGFAAGVFLPLGAAAEAGVEGPLVCVPRLSGATTPMTSCHCLPLEAEHSPFVPRAVTMDVPSSCTWPWPICTSL